MLILWTDDPMAQVVWTRPIHNDVDSEAFFRLVDSWIKNCSLEHFKCQKYNNYELPTRVVDVGIDGEEPFLFIADGCQGRWVTLSYCWGDVHPIITEVETLPARCKRLLFKDLPILFRDAITITRRLGYRYLWIDALCIIQDSHDDWLIESAKMGDIYKFSAITIAAEASEDCTVGIFKSSNEDRKANFTTIRAYSTVKRVQGSLHCGYNPNQFYASEGPLSHRAWTLQETHLSCRVLRFASTQVWWQCLEQQWKESGSNPERHPVWASSLKPRIVLDKGDEQFNDNRHSPLQCWYRIVNDYSSRNISFVKDIFPAISGVAKEDHRHVSQEYKAGLWSRDMHLGLLWGMSGPGAIKVGVDPLGYVAPSWSWASIDLSNAVRPSWKFHGREMYRFQLIDRPPTQHVAEIFRVHVETLGQDPFGQVSYGSLEMRGPCQVVCSCKVPIPFFDCNTDYAESVVPVGAFRRDRRGHDENFDVALIPDQRCYLTDGSQHRLLNYFHITSIDYGTQSEFDPTAYALIIEPFDNGINKYYRVGMAMLQESVKTSTVWPLRTVTIV
jgi:hypothetical protein